MAKGEEHINNEGMVEACRADPEKPNYRGCPFDSNGGHLPSNASPEERAEFEAKAEKVAQEAAQQDSTVGSSKSKKVEEEPIISLREVHQAAMSEYLSSSKLYVDDDAIHEGAIGLYHETFKQHGYGNDFYDAVDEHPEMEDGLGATQRYATEAFHMVKEKYPELSEKTIASSTFANTAHVVDADFRQVREGKGKFGDYVDSRRYMLSDMHDDRELAMDSFEDAYGDNDNEDEALSSGTISLYLSAAKRHGRDESDVFEDSNLENGMIKAGDYADDVYQQTMTENYHLPMDERRRKAASEAFEETAKLTDRAFRTKQDDHSKFFGDERLELEKRYNERRLENIRQEISNPNSPVYQEVQEMARRPDSDGEELGYALRRAVDRDRNFAEKLGMRRATSIHGGKHFVTDVGVTRDALAAEKRRLGVEDANTQSNWVFSQHMYDKIATAPDFNDTVRNPDTTPEGFREISLREMERKRDLIQHQMWDIAKPAADNFNPDDVAWAHELEKRRKSLRGY